MIVNADKDMRGAQRENVFLALDESGKLLGSLLIYPFFDQVIEREHPLNLYLHLEAEGRAEASVPIKDLLLKHALRRATEIKDEAGQAKARVYACFLKHQQDETAYFLRRGFRHDEGMLLLERQESAHLPQVEAPQEVTIHPWKMETETEQRQFIETHRVVFPRHPYSVKRLQELMAVPGWNNFTAWHDTEIAGNIMVYHKDAGGNVVGCIEDLFVQRRWQKRGIAKYLLYAALVHFRKTGIHRIQLEMWSANKTAFHLYRAFGFSAIDETEIAVGRYL